MSDYVLGYVIEFEDGEPGGQALHVGTEEECEMVAEKISAVSYSGPKRVRQCRLGCMPVEDSIWELPE